MITQKTATKIKVKSWKISLFTIIFFFFFKNWSKAKPN